MSADETPESGTGPQVLTKMGGSGPQVPMGSLLTLQARRDGAAPALTFAGETWSRARLDAAANRRARAMAELGVKQNDFVTIALPNSAEFYESVLATWKLGAIPNPVSPRLPESEMRGVLELVRPALAIGDAATISAGPKVPDAWRPNELLPTFPLPDIVARHWKAVASGGSTGRPKVIVDNHPSSWSPDTVMTGQQLGDTILNPGPLYHNAPFSISHITMLTGGHVVDMGKFDPLQALVLIEKHGIAYVYVVPTMMHRIWRLPEVERTRHDLSSLRTLLHTAAPCPPWLKQAYIEWLGPDVIWESYAGTENVGATTISGREWLTHRGSVGRASRGTLVILGEDGKPMPIGEIGQIHFQREPDTPKAYHYLGVENTDTGVETIGDLGWVDEEGYLYLADRRTDLIITGGANVYAAEVEAAIDALPGVGSSIVIGLPDVDLGQRVHAIVQRSDAGELNEAALRTHLSTLLVHYKFPRTFEFVQDNLRDDAGKARRSAFVAARSGVTS